MGKFSAKVDDWIRKSERLTHAVMQESVQAVVEDANTPIEQGGHMPVDTGYLRNSCTANIGGMPRGDGEGGDAQLASTLITWKPGQTLYIGWVANYARNMEWRYGFVRLATQKWQMHVNAAAKKAKSRAGR